jgi:ankyrin repeat protein
MFNTEATRKLKKILDGNGINMSTHSDQKKVVFEKMKSLLELGANPNVISYDDENEDKSEYEGDFLTPLFFCIEHNNLEMVELLVVKYNVSIRGNRRISSPIFYMASIPDHGGKEKLLDWFMARGSPIDSSPPDYAEDEEGYTPLIKACSNPQNFHFILMLLARGANPNAATPEGRTALHFAIPSYNDGDLEKIIYEFLQCKFNVHRQDDDGYTILVECILGAKFRSTVGLLLNGAKIILNARGEEPVFDSKVSRSERLIFLRKLNIWLASISKTMVDFGADPNTIDVMGVNLIYHAMTSLDDTQFAGMVDIFVSQGTNLNVQYSGHNKNTILHLCIARRKLQSSIKLLESGKSSMIIENDYGQRPMDMIGEYDDEFRDKMRQWARKTKMDIFNNASYQHSRANSKRLRQFI